MNRREFLLAVPALPELTDQIMQPTSMPEYRLNTARTVVWRRNDGNSFETAKLISTDHGRGIIGTVLAVSDSRPLRVDYRVECDEFWRTQRVYIEQSSATVRNKLSLARDPDARWWKNGQREDALVGCLDADLGISPSTNALPINRLKLEIGVSDKIQAACIQFPQLTVSPAHQSYHRLSKREYEYHNLDTGFTARITTDKSDLVAEYAGVWTRVAEASGALEPSNFVEALVSPGPSDEIRDAAATFNWLIGGWSGEVHDFDANGTARTGTGEWWFSWVLEGRAIQDVWIVPARALRGVRGQSPTQAVQANNRYGTTVRWFDRGSDQWRIVWTNPVSGAINRLAGKRVDDRIALLGEEDGRPIRWSFNEIRSNSFVWRGESLRKGLWNLDAEFRLHRIAPEP